MSEETQQKTRLSLKPTQEHNQIVQNLAPGKRRMVEVERKGKPVEIKKPVARAPARATVKPTVTSVRRSGTARLSADEQAARREALRRVRQQEQDRQEQEKQRAAPPPPEVKEEKPEPVKVKKSSAESGRARQSESARAKKTLRLKNESKTRDIRLSLAKNLQTADTRRKPKLVRSKSSSGEGGQKVIKVVELPNQITVTDLANRMAERVGDVIKTLMGMGKMTTANQTLDAETAELAIIEFGHSVKRVDESAVEETLKLPTDPAESLRPRPAVVTVMGHVDHGKTSLLDALRQTAVASGEAGGITQRIGAYRIVLASGATMTVLDTPGHEAFSAMRARGAKVTDVVILVVAADDGVQPQTIEAINHARAAGVPMVVAINKCDKPESDPTRVRSELAKQDVIVEQLGGDVQSVEVSAITGKNLESLIEEVQLCAELADLQANPDRQANGVVIESRLDQGLGSLATVLVQGGTLKKSDILVSGAVWGRARTLTNDSGKRVTSAGPSTPVEIAGLQAVPKVGDEFVVVSQESAARSITEYRRRLLQASDQAQGLSGGGLEHMLKLIKESGNKELPLLIKADVQGSVEAIRTAIDKLSGEKVSARVVHAGVGAINESDVSLAMVAKGSIIGFNVRAIAKAKDMAKNNDVSIIYHSVIYDIIKDVRGLLLGLVEPSFREKVIGTAEILEVFDISKIGKIAGCIVQEGEVRRGAQIRLLRDQIVIHQGKVKTLRRFKDEVREVKSGLECGIAIENYHDLRQADRLEFFELEKEESTL